MSSSRFRRALLALIRFPNRPRSTAIPNTQGRPPTNSAGPPRVDLNRQEADGDSTMARFRDWVRDAENFDPRRWLHADVKLTEGEAAKGADLRNRLDRLVTSELFEVGDLVRWKAGLRLESSPNDIMIVSRVLDKRQRLKRNTLDDYPGPSPYDMMVLVVERDDSCSEVWVQSRRLTRVKNGPA